MNKRIIEITCDKSCNKPFAIKHLKTTKLQNDIEKTYFRCPHCQQEYVSFYTDKPIRKMQSSMREICRKMKWADKKQMAQLKTEELQLKKFLAHSMKTLRNQVEANNH